MTPKRLAEIRSHMELGFTPYGEPPTMEELYTEILSLRDRIEDGRLSMEDELCGPREQQYWRKAKHDPTS